jgi:hypothetical protein
VTGDLPARAPAWTSSPDGWSATTASSRGSAHRPAQPNQDAAGAAVLPGGGLVATVADGHGGTAHARSEVGARLAVRSALAVVEAGQDTELVDLFPRVVGRWRRAVLAHLATHPAPDAHDPYRLYGSTLLVAVLREGRLELAQLGDGDVVVRWGSTVVRPVPGDARLVADVTTSLCLPTAEADVRLAVLDAEGADRPDLVLLATDGLGKSFADPGWWTTTATDYAALLDRLGPEVFRDRLSGWLDDSAAVGGDDTTVALLRRDPITTSDRTDR